MKKTFILLAIATVFHLTIILISCGCKDVVRVCHDITDVRLSALNNAGLNPEMPTDGTVLAKALLLRLYITTDQSICRNAKSSFVNNAYAMTKPDCRPDYYNDSVAKLTITSDHDYDDKHPAGTELNDLFKVPDGHRFYFESGAYDMYSLKVPDDTGTHIFSIRLHMADSSIIEATTKPVKLLK